MLLGRNGEMIVARVITPPEPILDLAEAKQHLRIEADVDDENDLVSGLISAAQAHVDGPLGVLGRAIGPQLLEVAIDHWPGLDRLPCPPLLGIESIRYVDPAGAWQDWPLPDPLAFDDLPRVRGRMGDLLIRYWAGYGTPKESPIPGASPWEAKPPVPIKLALKLLIAHWYVAREAVNIGNIVSEIPLSAGALLGPYAIRRV